MTFLRCGPKGEHGIRLQDVVSFDASNLDHLVVHITTVDGCRYTLEALYAVEAIMLLAPSVIESRRFKWLRHAWAIHNLVGHPLMQILAFFRLYKAAFWVHDATVPKPIL